MAVSILAIRIWAVGSWEESLTLSLSSIQRSRSLHEQIYETLRSSILSGEIPSGSRLIETQLSEQLQVSRTPIREAIRQLQRETLVTTDPQGNLRVAKVSAADAEQLYDCRIALEQLAIESACRHASPDQLRELEAIVVQAEQLAAQPQHSAQMLDLDYRFHRTIAESSGNGWLVFLLEQVFNQMTLLRVQTTRQNPSVLEIRVEHRQVYEAIAQQNAEVAIAAMREHLEASRQRVIEQVKIDVGKEG
ncbi:MAG: GntR family transcriptional regulator [Leptolyngbyaceae cyanobacterium SM1_3_5]|nr:GntR family transcriptional regulator [Leptolyngbyaceae cyanobacterium SM1_3_5]